MCPRLRRTDWILSNPWLWAGLGFGLCLSALLIKFLLGEDLVRIVFVFFGLLGVGTGLALRLQSPRPAFLPRPSPPRRAALMLGLASLFFLVVIALLVCLGLAIAGVNSLPWYPGQLVVILSVVGPVCLTRRLCAGAASNRICPAPSPIGKNRRCCCW